MCKRANKQTWKGAKELRGNEVTGPTSQRAEGLAGERDNGQPDNLPASVSHSDDFTPDPDTAIQAFFASKQPVKLNSELKNVYSI
jgi:hypothetical protein